MQAPEKFLLHQQTLWLSPERCIYWENENTLIASDMHFGKTGHFRKSGISVPQTVLSEDLQRLLCQIQFFRAERLIVVGDLFHSVANRELDLFTRWRNDFSALQIQLVKGNHDILKDEWYATANIIVSHNHLLVSKFCFIHDIKHACKPASAVDYYFSGHIHPCVTLKGLGRQELKLPCFYFTEQYAVLPAFGKFTGNACIEPRSSDSVFAIIPSNPHKKEHGVVMKV